MLRHGEIVHPIPAMTRNELDSPPRTFHATIVHREQCLEYIGTYGALDMNRMLLRPKPPCPI